MTPRERAEKVQARLYSQGIKFDSTMPIILIEQAILADRQALQSEITANLDQYKADSQKRTESQRRVINETIYTVYYLVQSVFAQQSQPIDKSKPHAFQGRTDRWCEICNRPDRAAIHKVLIDVALQQSVIADAVLAEREACAKIADEAAERSASWMDNPNNKSRPYTKGSMEESRTIAAQIRARSNQPEEKKCGNTFRNLYDQQRQCTLPFGHSGSCMFTGFDPDCSDCVQGAKEEAEEEAKRVETMLSSADRIATLHEWQARDVLTIQQLNESNNQLSLKVAQLEKEKNDLTKQLSAAKDHARAARNHSDDCLVCAPESPANRKA